MFNHHSLIPWGSFRGRQEEKWGSFRGWDHFGGCTDRTFHELTRDFLSSRDVCKDVKKSFQS